MTRSWLAGLVMCSTLGVTDAHAASITFDFEGLASGDAAALVSTQGGVTATLSRLDGIDLNIQNLGLDSPATWGVRTVNNFNDPSTSPEATLIINFSAPVTFGSIQFGDFGRDDDGTVSLTAFSGLGGTGNNLAGTSTAYPASLSIANDADVRTLSVSAFDILSFILTSGGEFPGTLYFDNLVVETAQNLAAVPEPATLLLLGLGLAGLARSRRSRRR